jgi:hypothetical protein
MAPADPVQGDLAARELAGHDHRPAHRRFRRRFQPLWVGGIVLRTALLVPAALATEPLPTAPQGPPAPPVPQVQRITGEEVQIEGKLYSPQTLFIVARPRESFGRDAVVPHYLQLVPSPQLLPYQLRIVPAVAVDTTVAEPVQEIPAAPEASGTP